MSKFVHHDNNTDTKAITIPGVFSGNSQAENYRGGRLGVLEITKLETYFIPFSDKRLASNCSIFFSKKSFVISGSRSGSSPMS